MHYNRFSQEYIDYLNQIDSKLISGISYSYYMNMKILTKQGSGADTKYTPVNFASPDPIIEMLMGNDNRFMEMLDDKYMKATYDVVAGKYPTAYNEIALVVNPYNQISGSILSQFNFDIDRDNMTYESFIGKEMKMISYDDWYVNNGSDLYPELKDESKYEELYNKGETIKITAVMRIKEGVPISVFSTSLLYRSELTKRVVADNLNSNMVKAQLNEYEKAKNDKKYIEKSVITGEEISKVLLDLTGIPGFNFEGNPDWINSPLINPFYLDVDERHEIYMQKIGASTLPKDIYVYPKSFDAKDDIKAYLDAYNSNKLHMDDKIMYMDAATMMTDMVKQIIDIISIVLVCFAAVSLVVSSIMIGIITYVSVVERTKEIGVLRAIGARKVDIGNVFNAETATIGITAGVMGVVIAGILTIPINFIIRALADGVVTGNIAILSPVAGIVLVVVSTILTLIAGLIPANIAAKKDPVAALRSE